MADLTKYAVIVAGGKGVRMGSAVPKQFLPLAGKPVLHYTVRAFIDAYPDINLILVLPEEQLSYAQMLLQSFPERIDITIVAGGATRYHSVQNGLKAVTAGAVVFVHDGVRPMVSPQLIRNCYEQAIAKGSAIPAIPVPDSIRSVAGGDSQPVNREHLRIIQTPQTFLADIILPAFEQQYQVAFTDEATVVEAYGTKIYLIDGEQSNIKVTNPADMLIAESLLKARMQDV